MRFEHRGYNSELYSSIRCPLGHSNVPGKLPCEVAVAVAGEIISLYHQQRPKQLKQQGVDWKHLKRLKANNINLPLSETQDH
jgi:xanthine dehydrogenase accessory factor